MLAVARGDAKEMMENRIKSYIQWFPGSMNDVADALSRDNDITDNKLMNIVAPSSLCRFQIISK